MKITDKEFPRRLQGVSFTSNTKNTQHKVYSITILKYDYVRTKIFIYKSKQLFKAGKFFF